MSLFKVQAGVDDDSRDGQITPLGCGLCTNVYINESLYTMAVKEELNIRTMYLK